MKNWRVKLSAMRQVWKAKAWAVITVGREDTSLLCDLTPTESIDALNALADASEQLVSMKEDKAAGKEGEANVNAAKQIIDGRD